MRSVATWQLGRRLFGAAAAGLLCALPHLLHNRFWLSIAVLILFKTLLTSSLRLNHLMGFISLGHVGFMLIGAYTSALLSSKCAVSVWLSIPAGAAAAFVSALLLGYPFTRVKGVYFVVLSFLMAEALRLTTLYSQSLTGGETGLARIPALPDLTVGGLVVSLADSDHYYYFLLAVTALLLLALYGLERSRFGFYCRAIAQSEAVCRAVGVNTTLIKIANFAIAAAVAGLTGALWAHNESVLTPAFSSAFGLMSSIFLLVYLHVGGGDHFLGPALGVSGLVLIEQLVRLDEQYVPMVLGGSMMIAAFLLPRGVLGAVYQIRRRWTAGVPRHTT